MAITVVSTKLMRKVAFVSNKKKLVLKVMKNVIKVNESRIENRVQLCFTSVSGKQLIRVDTLSLS